MKELLNLAMDIGEQMLVSGAEVHRVEDSMYRICRSFGAERVDVFIITSSMVVTVHFDDGHIHTETRRIVSLGTDFHKLDRLNQLSRRICAESMTAQEIRGELTSIINGKRYSFLSECLAYAVIAAAFTLFFGGNWMQVAVALLIGAFLRIVAFFSDSTVKNIFFSKFISAFTLAAAAYLFLKLGLVPRTDEIIIGNIMILIPGLGLTNALRDLFTGDSVAGALRTLEAVLCAVAIAAGYFLFVFLTGGHAV